jgi:ELWxxDGT repeat protein
MTVNKQLAMFAAVDASEQNGLWVTDGTALGTHELTNIQNAFPGGLFGGNIGFSPDITTFDGYALFEGVDASGYKGLWITDGTSSGTHEIAGIVCGSSSDLFPFASPDFTVFNGEVLFTADNTASNRGLWVTNGTSSGTHEITGIANTFSTGLHPQDLTVFNGEVIFDGIDAADNNGVWVTDGTAQGTHELNINGEFLGTGGMFGGAGNLGVEVNPDFTVFNNEVLFVGTDSNAKTGLWVTDGTTSGTHEVTTATGTAQNLTVFNNEVLFAGGDHGLWVTDGTAHGTHELNAIKNAYPGALSPSNFVVFNGKALFEGMDAQNHESLWVTNGTASGTHELVGIKNANPNGLDPQEMTALNGEVLFRGLDANGQINLWITNGTAQGTHELTGIADAYAGSGGLNAHAIADVALGHHDYLLF